MLTLLALVGKMLARPATDRTDATRNEAAETSGTMQAALIAGGCFIADLINLIAALARARRVLQLNLIQLQIKGESGRSTDLHDYPLRARPSRATPAFLGQARSASRA
jgi:hypothetical protein